MPRVELLSPPRPKLIASRKPLLSPQHPSTKLPDKPPGPPPSTESSTSLLNRIHLATFDVFARLDYRARKSARKTLGTEVLKLGQSLKDQVHWRQFALMHCPGIIRETSLEGGQEEVSARASLSFINSCLNHGRSLYFSADIPELAFRRMQRALSQFNELLALRPAFTEKPTATAALKGHADAFLDKIHEFQRHNPSKTVYLPLGYRHGTSNQGHALSCKLEERGDEVILTLFNLGNGSEPHATLDYSIHQKKTSFAFFPIAIPKKLFYGDLGRDAFCYLFRYLSDAPLSHQAPYDGNDIYDIFYNFFLFPGLGKILELGPKQEEYGAPAQISGNCPELAIRCILEDVLISCDVPEIERRKFFLNRDFQSLLGAYNAFTENLSCHPSARELLNDAARAFAANVQELNAKKQVSQQELIISQAVVHEIQKATEDAPYVHVTRHHSPVPISDDHRVFQSMPSLYSDAPQEIDITPPELDKFKLEPPVFDKAAVASLPSLFHNWITTASSLPQQEAFYYVADCIRQLPIPMGRNREAEEDVWNGVPPERVTEILRGLESLLKVGLHGAKIAKYQKDTKGPSPSHNFGEQFLMIYSAYAIADKLARLCDKETRLEGFSCPFLPYPFAFEPHGFTSLPLREDNERYTLIQRYLTGKKHTSDEGYKDPTIFPVAPVLDVQQYVSDLFSGRHSKDGVQGRNHVAYLARLLPTSVASATETYLASFYRDNWMQILPPQVQSLYYFSFLANTLFSAPGRKFPVDLSFTKAQISGKPALKIENPYHLPDEKPKKKQDDTPQIALFSEEHRPNLESPVQDKRFYVYEGRKGCSEAFIDLHSPELRTLRSNEAVCYRLTESDREKWGIEEEHLRTILHDTRKWNLSFWQVLQDFSTIDHHFLLSHPGVQYALDSCFFKPGSLLERLQAEPKSLIPAFRAFIAEGLRNYRNNPSQIDGILFLLREGISFESYTPKDQEREETLQLYRQVFNAFTFFDADFHAHKLFLDTQQEQRDLPALFSSYFSHNSTLFQSYPGKTWVYDQYPRFFRTLANQYRSALDDQEIRNAICNRIIYECAPKLFDQLPATGWKGNFPQFTCGDLMIDFYSFTIANTKYRGVLRFAPRINTPKHKPLELKFWTDKNGGLVSLDEKLKYCPKRDKWFELIAGLNGEVEECEILNLQGKKTDSSQEFLDSDNLAWVYHRLKSGMILISDRRTGKPYLLMETDRGTTVYRRLDEEGRILPDTLANLSELRPTDPLYRYTARYAHPNDILCFVNKTRREIQEINFHKMGLHFLRDERGLAWKQDPNFCLITNESNLPTPEARLAYGKLMQELNEFEGAFVLYNSVENKWNVLLPVSKFSKVIQKGEDYSRNVELRKARSISEYYHYEFDPVEKSLKTLRSDQDRANAYLAVLYKMQRDYDRAFKYLARVRTEGFFSDATYQALVHFTDIIDHTPSSLAFNLKLCLFIIKNKNLMLEKQFGEKTPNHHYIHFLHWGMQNYKEYLNLLGQYGNSSIPETMRLSDGEKMMLILAFRRSYQEQNYQDKEGNNWEARWKKDQPVLDAQYNVYFSAQRENSILPKPQEISLVPPIFSAVKRPDEIPFSSTREDFIIRSYTDYHSRSLKPKEREEYEIPSYAVRVTEKAIAAHFPQLYEEARTSRSTNLSRFDFDLQAMLKTTDQSHETYLGHILFWVRHFPEHFADLSLAHIKPSNISLQKEILNQISWRVRCLTSDRNYARMEQRLKDKYSFTIKKPIHISAPRERFPNTPLQLRKDPIEGSIEDVEKQIYRIFNSPYKIRDGVISQEDVEGETLFLLGKDSAQTLSFPKKARAKSPSQGGLLPEILMKQVILKNNLAYLLKHRPMLQPLQMQELCALVNEWYHRRVLLKCETDGITYIPYDYQEYPEISYYFLKTGKFPRQQQLDNYLWICERLRNRRSCHFQQEAGGGKTDVTTPLLNLAAKKFGLMPVTCVTQAIYPVDKENLSYNLRSLEEDLCYLEVGMHMINQLSALDLEFIFSQLMQYKSEGKALIITRHTYDALRLIRDLALKNAAEEDGAEPKLRLERGLKIRYSQNILNFFEDQCLLICDESHQNADAMTRAIYGTGEFAVTDPEESAHISHLMSPLRRISGQISLSKTDVDIFRRVLARGYLSHFPKLDPKDHPSILDYWTNPEAQEPEILASLAKNQETRKQAKLIALTGHFLLTLLPDLLEMRTDVDHARSLYPQRKYEVPAHNKLPSTAEYDDTYKTCALTDKGNYDRGLYESDVRQILTDLIKANEAEKLDGFPSDRTPSNLIFRKWLSAVPNFFLEDVQLGNPSQMQRLYELLGRNPAVIDYFLVKYAYKGIGTPSQQLSCTTTDVFSGFRYSVSFSATPREDLANPRCITEYLRDPDFQARVLEKWNDPKNSTIVFIDDEDRFFQAMEQERTFEETVLIDPRGFFTSPNHEVAKNWLKTNSTLDGVLYFNEARSTDVDRKEKISLLLRDGRTLTLTGSDIKTALKEHGLEWEKLNLGTFYGPRNTESANILQKPNAKSFFFLGEGLTTSHGVQAVMRMRGFVNQNQTITNVCPTRLRRKIFPNEPSMESLQHWMGRNERTQEEKRIILNAFQEIYSAIARDARKKIKDAHAADASPTMDRVVAAYKPHARGFVESRPADAYDAFGAHEVPEASRTVLIKYASRIYARFGYDIPFLSNTVVVKELLSIVSNFERRIAKIATNPEKQTSGTVEHHLEMQLQIQAQREQRKVRPRPVDLIPLDGDYGPIRPYDPKYLHVEKTSANKVFKTTFFSNGFFLRHNYILTAKRSDTSNPKPQTLKPVQFFMIIVTKDGFQADVNSHEILATEQDDLLSAPETVKDLEHTVFMVSADGRLVQKGKGAITPPEEAVDRVLRSQWLKDLTIDAALLNGRIPDEDAILQRLKEKNIDWASFKELWRTIVEAHDGNAQTKVFERLEKRYFELA